MELSQAKIIALVALGTGSMLAGKCYWGNKSKVKYIIMRSEFLIKNRLEREKSDFYWQIFHIIFYF